MATKTPTKHPMHVKITKTSTWIRHANGVEIVVPKTWIREYVEYALSANQEITIEVFP
jgi:hypothetical protein